MRAILRAPVDLLWNGGIGTFVKASERDARRSRATATPTRSASTAASCAPASSARAATSVSPSAAASSTRPPAVASTRTRSTTPRASTAPTTRSTSRSCSARRSRAGRSPPMAGDTLLAAAADEVCDLVLYDNYLQAQILSQEQEMAPQRVEAHEMLHARARARRACSHRELEALPATDELAERRRQGRGLTRPELAVLLAYAKRSLYPEGAGLGHPRRPGARRRPARVLPAPHRRGHRASSTAGTGCDARSSPRSSPTTSSTRSASPGPGR